MATSEGLLINNLYWLFIPLASETLRFTHHDLPIEKQMQFLAKKLQSFCKREKKSPTERTFWNQNQLRTKRIFFAKLFFFQDILQVAVKKIEKKTRRVKKRNWWFPIEKYFDANRAWKIVCLKRWHVAYLVRRCLGMWDTRAQTSICSFLKPYLEAFEFEWSRNL